MPIVSHLTFRHVYGVIVPFSPCLGMLRCTAVHTHSVRVMRQLDRMLNVPLLVGSGAHLAVAFSGRLPKGLNMENKTTPSNYRI